MVCNKCGAECPDGVRFCGDCGARLDGKKPCPFCGEPNDEKTTYCVGCGRRIDGKTVCECGTVHETKFCPNCGKSATFSPTSVQRETAATAVPMYEVKPVTRKKANVGERVSFWCDKLQSIAFFIGACLAMIFVFFIGGAIGDMEGLPSSIQKQLGKGGIGSADNLFYYFGQFYKDMDDFGRMSSANSSNFFYGLYENAAYTYGIAGTVVMSISLLAVVLFGVLALVNFLRGLVDNSAKKTNKWSILTVVFFFVGIGAFFLLNQATAEAFVEMVHEGSDYDFSESEVLGASYSLNGATVCGFVLCVITLLIGVGFSVAKNGKTLKTKGILTKVCMGGAGLVLIAAIFALLANLGISAEASYFDEYVYEDYYDYYYTRESISGSLGLSFTNFNMAVAVLSSKLKGVLVGTEYVNFTSNLEMAEVFFNITTVLAVVTLFVMAWAVYERIKSVTSGDNGDVLLSAVLLLAFVIGLAVAFFIGCIGAEKAMETLLDSTGSGGDSPIDYSFGLAGIIVMIVFAVLNLILPIVQKTLAKKIDEPKSNGQTAVVGE